jgi:hypothetical protein
MPSSFPSAGHGPPAPSSLQPIRQVTRAVRRLEGCAASQVCPRNAHQLGGERHDSDIAMGSPEQPAQPTGKKRTSAIGPDLADGNAPPSQS